MSCQLEKHFSFFCNYYGSLGSTVPLLSTHQAVSYYLNSINLKKIAGSDHGARETICYSGPDLQGQNYQGHRSLMIPFSFDIAVTDESKVQCMN